MWEMPLYAQLHHLPPFELLMNKPLKEENIWQQKGDEIFTSFEYKNEHYRGYNIVSNEKFSGSFSCVINEKNDFSTSFIQVVSPRKKIEVSFMALATDSIDMTFVGSKGDWWEGINLKEKVNPNGKWQKVELEFNLPKKQSASDTLALYLWNNKSLKTSFYIDDVSIRLLK